MTWFATAIYVLKTVLALKTNNPAYKTSGCAGSTINESIHEIGDMIRETGKFFEDLL